MCKGESFRRGKCVNARERERERERGREGEREGEREGKNLHHQRSCAAFILLKIASLACSVTRFGDLLDFGNFLKPLATINLPKSITVLGNFCVGAKILNFSSEIMVTLLA